MMQNKEFKKIFNDEYSFNIVKKDIKCFLDITKGDQFDIVRIKDSVKNETSVGELTEFIMKEVVDKWKLKPENLVWVEDFSEVNDMILPNENLSLVSFKKEKDNYLIMEKKPFTEETYNSYFIEIKKPLKKKIKKK